jgi:crotonobetaine/carnitine-CoA ligase
MREASPRPLPPGSADTVAAALTCQARKAGDRTFLVFEGADGTTATRTYSESELRANRAARLLQRLGVRRGDTFHVHLANSLEFFDCWFGAARIGAIMVPTSPLSTAEELTYIIGHAEPALTITSPDLVDVILAARRLGAEVTHLLVTGPWVTGPSGRSFEEELSRENDTLPNAPAPGPLDVVAMLYTSGTTSRPKGVLVTNANYMHVGETMAQFLRLRPDDRQLVVLPLFHANAQYYSTMSALVTGASVAVMERFSASRWGQQAARHGATVASLFAAPIRMILAQPADPADRTNQLRVALFAQNLAEEQLEAFQQRFGCGLLQIYGMTETIAPPTLNPLFGERRNVSIGRPALWARLRIVDETGGDVNSGQVGELLVGGEPGTTLMAGYYKDPVATVTAMNDGWLSTGDNVRVDADGYLYFVDRGKDMIKCAGENVASSEVERVVNAHPAVYESAAIGVPDPIRDELIKVFVVLHAGASATESDIIEWCSARLSKFRVPRFVEFVDTLPRTSVGKVQKHLLRRTGQVQAITQEGISQ